jgi:hypothetical protein
LGVKEDGGEQSIYVLGDYIMPGIYNLVLLLYTVVTIRQYGSVKKKPHLITFISIIQPTTKTESSIPNAVQDLIP